MEVEGKSTKTWMECERTWVLARAAGWILTRGAEQTKAGQDLDAVGMKTMISAHTAVPQLPKRDNLVSAGPERRVQRLQDHISVFQRRLFVSDKLPLPESCAARTGQCADSVITLIIFSLCHFILCPRWTPPVSLLGVTGDGNIQLGFFFYFIFIFNVCLNYSAQAAYVLMLLLPHCIHQGHIDPQITPEPIP